MTHVSKRDYFCPRCGMEVLAFIPHECDPTICRKCDGKGKTGNINKKYCLKCGGTGRINFNPPPEENPEGAIVNA